MLHVQGGQLRKAAAMEVENRPSANKLRQGFVELAEGLLSSIVEVFPECDETRHALELFRVVVKDDPSAEDKFVRKCTALFKQNSARLKENDSQALFAVVDGIPLLKDIDVRAKWSDPDFSAESKQNLWHYLSALETYGGLYCAVPSGVMGRIEKVATTMSAKLQEGTLDISSIDIAAFGEDLMSGLSPEELRDFEGSLPDVYSCVGNVASMLARQSGNDSFDAEGLMAKVTQMQGSSGPDLGNFIQEMSASLVPGNLNPVASSMVTTLAQQMLSGAIARAPPSSVAALSAPEEGEELGVEAPVVAPHKKEGKRKKHKK